MRKRSLFIVVVVAVATILVVALSLLPGESSLLVATAVDPSATRSTDSPTKQHLVAAPSESEPGRASVSTLAGSRAALVMQTISDTAEPVADVRVIVDLAEAAEPDTLDLPRTGRDLPRANEARRITHFSSITDTRGIVRFEISEDAARGGHAHVSAERPPDLASDANIRLEPPFTEKARTIRLYPSASILVRVKDPRGESIPNVEVRASPRSSIPLEPRARGRTDANGEVRFEHLCAGTYDVTAERAPVAAAGPQSLSTRGINLVRGGIVDVDLELTDVLEKKLALRGKVVDERGQPLAGVEIELWTTSSTGTIITLDDGEFEYWDAPSESASFSCQQLNEDLFEPTYSRLPFGTDGLLIRRIRALPEINAWGRALDARTHTILTDCTLILCNDAGNNSRTGHRQPLLIQCKVRPDWNYTIRAPGYLSSQGSLEDLARRCAGKQPVEFELEPGFAQDVTVVDAESSAGLVEARLSAANGSGGLTDAQGRISLRSGQWPSSYHVEHEGYFSIDWRPADDDAWRGIVRLRRSSQ